MRAGFIGAGKVGFTLGKYLHEHGAEVTGYYSRDTRDAEEAARFTESKVYEDIEKLLRDTDVLFLTVPDSSIGEVYQMMNKADIGGKYICHTSGSLTSRAPFPDAKERGAYTYSVHPLFAVSDKYNAYKELSDVFFAIEGDESHLDTISQFLENTGLTVNRIDSDSKVLYHAGAVIASNLAIALMESAAGLLEDSGFEAETARAALAPLAKGNLEHLFSSGPVASLTGPIERGDAETVEKHLNAITRSDDRDIYILLSRKLLEIAKRKHPDRKFEDVEQLLDKWPLS